MNFDSIYVSLEFQSLAKNLTYIEYVHRAGLNGIPDLLIITEEEWNGLKILFKVE